LYLEVLKYVSFILAVPYTMWPPLAQTVAKPIQPVEPYSLLQTFTRPLVAGQVLVQDCLSTIVVFSLVESVQSS